MLLTSEKNVEAFYEGFVDMKKTDVDLTKKAIHLHFAESVCRRSKCSSAAGAGNIWWCMCIMRKCSLQRFKKHARSSKFTGTTHSCAYTELSWPAVETLPMVEDSDKKDVYSWSSTFNVNASTLDTDNATST